MQRVVERTRSLKTLLEKGADALLPKKVGDLWHKPEVSAKLAARARKILLAEGKTEEVARLFGELKPAPSLAEPRFKGHKVDKTKDLREAKVAAGLAKQEDLVAAYRKSRKLRTGPETAFDWITLTPKQLRLKQRQTPGSDKK